MTGNELMVRNVRLAFTQDLFIARAFKDEAGKPKKRRAKLLIGKNDPQVPGIMAEIARLAKEEWKDKADQIMLSIKGNKQSMAILDGDLQLYDGFKDHYSINATRREQDGSPLFLRANPGTVEKPNLATAEELYSGAYVNAHISFWTWSKNGFSMNCNLLGLQFYRKGDPFSSGTAASSISAYKNEEPEGSVIVGKDEFSAFV